MGTDNRRVAAYLPPEVDEKLKQFKLERGLATAESLTQNDSQALIQILSEYFGVSQSVAYQGSSDLTERIECIEGRLSKLKDELLSELLALDVFQGIKPQANSEPIDDIPSEPPSELNSKSPSELSDVNLDSFVEKGILVPLPSLSGRTPGFMGRDLAKRLSIHASTLSQKKKEASSELFAEWSANRDPDGVSWKFLPELSIFQPIGKIPPDLEVELHAGLDEEISNTLTVSALARRLGVSRSTLSSFKRDKSAQELMEWTRKKDPDGIGWILIPEFSRFQPERDLPGDSLSILQGSLLAE